MLQKIRIKLKSYDHATLDQSAAEIVRDGAAHGCHDLGPVPLPTRRTVYTVLRSPHVDKKSREQFEIRIHKRLIDITRSTAADDGSAREARHARGRRHRDQEPEATAERRVAAMEPAPARCGGDQRGVRPP